MSASDVDEYFAALPEPKRATLEQVRCRILEIVPDAEQRLSYGVPAFVVDGVTVAGLAAFTRHLSFLPHSGSVLADLEGRLDGYQRTKSTLHFPVDQPLPSALLRALIKAKLSQR